MGQTDVWATELLFMDSKNSHGFVWREGTPRFDDWQNWWSYSSVETALFSRDESPFSDAEHFHGARYGQVSKSATVGLSSLPISGSFARHPVGSSASCKPRCLLENMTSRVNLRMAPLNFRHVFEPQMDSFFFLHGFFSNPTSKSLSSEVSAGILMAVIQSSMGGSEWTESTESGIASHPKWPAGKPAEFVCRFDCSTYPLVN